MVRQAALVALGAVLALALAGTAVLLNWRKGTDLAPIVINTPPATAVPVMTATLSPIQVYVNGAVAAPDVYTLPANSRVKQAIEAAGGFSTEANTKPINLAQPLTDGIYIYVPFVTEDSGAQTEAVSDVEGQTRGGIMGGIGGKLININTAGVEELDTLPGIGPVIAQEIIHYRLANGDFRTIEAILEVSGIGPAKFEQIRDLITTGN